MKEMVMNRRHVIESPDDILQFKSVAVAREILKQLQIELEKWEVGDSEEEN